MVLSEEQQTELQKRVPRANFIENVEELCRKEGMEALQASINQVYNKYRLVEGQLLRSQESMVNKIPEIEKTLQMIDALRSRPKAHVDFMLSEGVFVRGLPKEGLDRISLWLGANTVVELSFREAEELLASNLANAKSSMGQIRDELEFIKEQKTISEVNVARVHNFSIMQKRNAQIEDQ